MDAVDWLKSESEYGKTSHCAAWEITDGKKQTWIWNYK